MSSAPTPAMTSTSTLPPKSKAGEAKSSGFRLSKRPYFNEPWMKYPTSVGAAPLHRAPPPSVSALDTATYRPPPRDMITREPWLCFMFFLYLLLKSHLCVGVKCASGDVHLPWSLPGETLRFQLHPRFYDVDRDGDSVRERGAYATRNEVSCDIYPFESHQQR